MKILYGIQGMGNGHVTRSISIIKELAKHSAVDILVSGMQHQVDIPLPVAYKCSGLEFVIGETGSINYFETIKSLNIRKFYAEALKLSIKKYDCIISDYEPISILAASRAGIPTIGISNQVSLFDPQVKQPDFFFSLRKFFMKQYAVCDYNIGLHYTPVNSDMETPVIREEIRTGCNQDKGFGLVYLPFLPDQMIHQVLSGIKEINWLVFTRNKSFLPKSGNVFFETIDYQSFTDKLLSCHIVITAAGFGTTSEALYLGKKMIVIPIRKHFEQMANAMALEDLSITVLKEFNADIVPAIRNLIHTNSEVKVNYPDNVATIANKVFNFYNKNTPAPVYNF